MKTALSRFIAQIHKTLEENKRQFPKIIDLINRYDEKSQEYGFKNYQSMCEAFTKLTLDAGFFPYMRAGLKVIWDFMDGWYRADNKNKYAVDYWATQYSGLINHIPKDLSWFPSERAHILLESLQAYNEGKYYVAIPVLYTQIEALYGIANKKTIETRIITQTSTDHLPFSYSYNKAQFENAIQEVFYKSFNFGSVKEMGKYDISRHALLHGGSIDYGTKENYLRVFSLLLFTLDTIERPVNQE